MDVVSLVEGEWLCYSCQFNGVIEVDSLREENCFVTEAACLMELDWSC